jgi:hypothetical protein
MENSTLACCSWARGTSWGSMPAIAGKLAADTVPLTTSRTITIHSSATPVITSAATVPWVSALSRAVTQITRVRSNRSASTPPKSRNTTIGTVWAARTKPRALAESLIVSTAKARATETIIDPVSELNRAA